MSDQAPPRAPGRARWWRLARAAGPALAGPLLIAGVTLVALRAFAFGGRTTAADVVRYWLPMFSYLGRNLADGRIPSWAPEALSGMPFLADPQSGWMAFTPMALFTALPPDAAIRWLVIAQPILAGLGVYWFLRAEGVSRASAAISGVTLALLVAQARIVVTVRFPGVVAWTALALAACARFVHAGTWPARLAWCGATALAWGQAVAAHVPLGVVVGTLALSAYGLVRFGPLLLRPGDRRRALGMLAILGAAVLLLNLAFLLPRLALADRTNLDRGYAQVRELSRELTGRASPAHPGPVADAAWPLNATSAPGTYAGGAVAGLALAAWWCRRRALAAAFTLFGVACYLLATPGAARAVPEGWRSATIVDLYLHGPAWMVTGTLLSLAVLAGLGAEAWRKGTPAARAGMLLPGLALWFGLPALLGAPPSDLLVPAASLMAVALSLAAPPGVRFVAVLAPVVVAAEILRATGPDPTPAAAFRRPSILVPRHPAVVEVAEYVTPTRLARLVAAEGGRVMSLGLAGGQHVSAPWAIQNNEGLLHGFESTGGYQAVQPDRYWRFVRALQREPIKYNYAVFVRPTTVALDLLQVRWVVVPPSRRVPPLPPARLVARDHGYRLFELRDPSPRASVLTRWRVVPGPDASLRAVTEPGFDPASEAVLEADPGLDPDRGCRGGSATYFPDGPQAASVVVESACDAIVLVRNVHDPGWSAEVDGRAVPVLAADHVVQAVPVSAGRHTIRLRYDDPSVRAGVVVSGSALAVLVATAAFLAVGGRARRRRDVLEDPGRAGAT